MMHFLISPSIGGLIFRSWEMGMKKKNAKKIKKNSKLYDGRVAIRNAKRSINLRHPSEIAVIIF